MSDQSIEEESAISKSDVEKLLSSVSIEEAEEKLSKEDAATADIADELEELSSDDLDSLMESSSLGFGEDLEDEDLEDEDLEDEDLDLISQDDIDKIKDTSSKEKQPLSDKDMAKDSETVSKDDASNLLDAKKSDQDNVLDESEAMDIKDTLNEQEVIDDLIENFDNKDVSEPVAEESEQEPELDVEQDKSDEKIEDSMVSFEHDTDEEKDSDVSQEDIDALLQGPESDNDNDADDDIDSLLMSLDKQGKGVSDDGLTSDEIDGLTSDDIDNLTDDYSDDLTDDLTDDDIDDKDDEENILEDDYFDEDKENYDEELETELNEEKPKSGWSKTKFIMAGVSALLVLTIAIPSAYFLFFLGDPGEMAETDPITQETKKNDETKSEAVNTKEQMVNTKKQDIVKKPGNIVLKNFIVLAPDSAEDITYITADISIDYSDQKAYHRIQKNMSFYRDLIYNSIKERLGSKGKKKITEADILLVVETTLKKVLPEHYIDRVSFKSFKRS